jgi:hypothetical protein
MTLSNKARTFAAILLFGVGLVLSSCIVYEPGPYHHGYYHDRWR